MSERFENKSFEEIIRNKLEDYETAVETNAWNGIEKSLSKRKRIKYLYLTITGVAAAGVMFLLTFNPLRTNDGCGNVPEQITEMRNLPLPNNENDTLNKRTNDKIQPPVSADRPAKCDENKPIRDNRKKQTNPANPDIAITYNPENKTAVVSVPQSPEKNLAPAVPLPSVNKANADKPEIYGQKTLETPTRANQTSISLVDNRPKTADETKENKPKVGNFKPKNTNYVASMNLSAGNNLNMNMQNSEMIPSAPLLALDAGKEYIRDAYKNDLGLPDNAESQYGVPLSGKLMIRKNINSTWAIETGVSYSYLSTKYKWGKNVLKQQLHYLGIPVNAVCYVVSKPNWNVYVSAGGTIEKGVYASIDRNDDANSSITIKGIQLSANASFGATYKLYQNLGMFFEPQIGYFFNNKQPESIRTSVPLSFGLGIGLRYNL